MNIILGVAGPTASGKSDLAVALSEQLSGEVVSIDSVQVYKKANIGTAKILDSGRRGIPHHLIDILEPDESISAGSMCELADSAIAVIQRARKQAVVTFGTTLYSTALLHGISKTGPSSPELREELKLKSSEDLWCLLQSVDPRAQDRLHKNDRHRVIRAIEIAKGGKLYSDVTYGAPRYNAVIFYLEWEREELYQRINKRSQQMVENGLLDEAESLLSEYGAKIPIFSSIGYKEALACLQGKLEVGDLIEAIAQSTRRLAKRQSTYWRNEPGKRGWRESKEVSPLDLGGIPQLIQQTSEVGITLIRVCSQTILSKL